MMELIPIKKSFEENDRFVSNPDCRDILQMSVDYYNKVGYSPPWIGYFAQKDGYLVGSAGFKGRPKNGRVEIAYGTFELYRRNGYGTEICKLLVELALKTDPTIIVTARTLLERNYSTRILEKNSFQLLGKVIDEEDGEVWEWQYTGKTRNQSQTEFST